MIASGTAQGLLKTLHANSCDRVFSPGETSRVDRSSEPEFHPDSGCARKPRWRNAPETGEIPSGEAARVAPRSPGVQTGAAKNQDQANPPEGLGARSRGQAITCLQDAQSAGARREHPEKEFLPMEASRIWRSVPSTACG